MDCPKCGAENPDSAARCGDCGSEFASPDASSRTSKATTGHTRGRKSRVPILTAVVVTIILVLALVAVNLSPEYSWSASIRDHDGDGVPDSDDDFPYDEEETTDGDGDGVGDNADAFPSEPTQWSDLDADGEGDNLTGVDPDEFRDDPTEWDDTDGDGVGDNSDAFPDDDSQWSDLDGDGYGDNLTGTYPDLFRDDSTEWNDTDGDGVGDNSDAYPENPDLWDNTTPVVVYRKTSITIGVRIIVYSISTPHVPWSYARVQLSDGVNFAEWSPVSTDLDGGSAIAANYSTVSLGSLAVCCVIFDVGGDGCMGGSDYFQLFTYGGATTFSTGTNYHIVLLFEPTSERMGDGCYFTGSDATTPAAGYMWISLPEGPVISILSISQFDVSWDLIRLQLTDGVDGVDWEPLATDLDEGGTTAVNYSTRILGTLTVCCQVTDWSGDGFVSEGDSIYLYTFGGAEAFSSDESYHFVMIYEPSSEWMGVGVLFTGDEGATPTATYAKSTISNGVKVTVLSITRSDVSWDLVRVQLSDGTNFAEWDPVAADLDGGSATSANYSTDSLGTLTVCCIVVDIAGNGCVSGSDYFLLFTYGGAAPFSTSTAYSAVLIYEPTGETIGTGISFTG